MVTDFLGNVLECGDMIVYPQSYASGGMVCSEILGIQKYEKTFWGRKEPTECFKLWIKGSTQELDYEKYRTDKAAGKIGEFLKDSNRQEYYYEKSYYRWVTRVDRVVKVNMSP